MRHYSLSPCPQGARPRCVSARRRNDAVHHVDFREPAILASRAWSTRSGSGCSGSPPRRKQTCWWIARAWTTRIGRSSVRAVALTASTESLGEAGDGPPGKVWESPAACTLMPVEYERHRA